MSAARRILALVALLVVAAVLATSCAAPTATPTPTTAPTAVPTQAPFPATVKDAYGKDFTLAAAPQKIVSLPIWATEELFSLVDLSRVAGISKWISDPNTTPIADAAKAVTNRVESGKPEAIIALQPDLVVLDTFSDFDGSLAKTLTDAGIPVLTLASPVTLDDVRATIATLAAVTGESAKGAALVADFDAKIKSVTDKLATLDASKRMTAMYVYPSYNDPAQFTSYNSETPISAILVAAGLTNVCDAPKYSDVSKEKVVSEWKPQLFVVPSSSYLPDFSGTIDDAGASAKAAILADTTLKDVPAVVNDRIYGIADKYMASTSQYMADAVVLLAKAAYPDLFK